MSKTPEELAEDHAFNIFAERYESLVCEDRHVYAEAVNAFIAGYEAAKKEERLKLSELYSHGSDVQKIASAYLKSKGIEGALLPYAENRFIDGYAVAQEHAHAALEEAEARIQELRDQLMEESGGRLKLFKNDADAKAAYQECLEEIDLDKAWQEGYKAAQEEADTCEHILDMSKMVDVSSSETLNNWISVKDRLPEDGTGWLTVYGSIPNLRFFVGPGYYDYAKKEWLSRFLNYRARTDAANLVTDQIEYLPFEQVTHWMPLPAAPKEEA
jgi:hypothetical protein